MFLIILSSGGQCSISVATPFFFLLNEASYFIAYYFALLIACAHVCICIAWLSTYHGLIFSICISTEWLSNLLDVIVCRWFIPMTGYFILSVTNTSLSIPTAICKIPVIKIISSINFFPTYGCRLYLAIEELKGIFFPQNFAELSSECNSSPLVLIKVT